MVKDIKTLMTGSQAVIDRAPCVISVKGEIYKVKQISNWVRRKISNLEKEVYVLENKSKEGLSLRKAKRIDKKIRTLHSKTAAYYLLNNKALFIPFLWAIKWRMLDLKDSEVTYKINNAGSNSCGQDFFLANWHITRVQLVLSTMLVGKGIEKYQEREESAENMLTEDALPKKADNK